MIFHYQDLLGEEIVYVLHNGDEKTARYQLSETYWQRLCLFGRPVTYTKLSSLISQSAVTKSTNLANNFNFKDCCTATGIDKKEKVFIYTGSESVPSSGIKLIGFLPVPAAQNGLKNNREIKH